MERTVTGRTRPGTWKIAAAGRILAATMAGLWLGAASADAQVTASDVALIEDVGGQIQKAAGFTADAWLQKAACRFYEVTAGVPSNPEILFVFTTYAPDLLGDVQSGLTVFQQTRGIGKGRVDQRAAYCATGRFLRHAVKMGSLTNLPEDPFARLPRRPELPMNAVQVMAHEHGHHWMAHVSYRLDDGLPQHCDLRARTPSSEPVSGNCDGYAPSEFGLHWSALFDSGGIMFGNRIEELPDGTFRFYNDGHLVFGPLDRYLMGLLPAESVGPLLLVRTPDSRIQPSDYPVSGELIVEGTARRLSVRDVIAYEGTRHPEREPCHWKGAMALVHPPGKPPSQAQVDLVARYANAYESFYAEATGRLGSIDLTLDQRGLGTRECPAPGGGPPPEDPPESPPSADLPGGETGPRDVAETAGSEGTTPGEVAAELPPGPDRGTGEETGSGTQEDHGAEACEPGTRRCHPLGNGIVQQCAEDGRSFREVADCGLGGLVCRDGTCVSKGGGGCRAGGSPVPAGAPWVLAALGLALILRRFRNPAGNR
ncbi:hypothetical protein KBD49_14230 [Myxococcota bacterium]|nr:hypothetical protein [Myxococcota bacterium]